MNRDFGFSLVHTWNQAIDNDGSPLRRRAKHKLSTTLHHTWRDKFNSRLTIFHKSGIRDGIFSAKRYTTVRVALRYQLLNNLKINDSNVYWYLVEQDSSNILLNGMNILDQKQLSKFKTLIEN